MKRIINNWYWTIEMGFIKAKLRLLIYFESRIITPDFENHILFIIMDYMKQYIWTKKRRNKNLTEILK